MEACETSMEKFYRAMHKLGEIQNLDLLLKRMISHVRLIISFEEILFSPFGRLLMH